MGAEQVLAFLTPVVVGYAFFRDRLALPDVDPSQVQLDPRAVLGRRRQATGR